MKLKFLYYYSLLFFVFSYSFVSGQTQVKFEAQINEAVPGVFQSTVSCADINNDGSKDVLITGYNDENQPTTKLYKNNGNGDFSQVFGVPFVNVTAGATAFIDFDGDDNDDVLITGYLSSNQRVAKLYKNEGNNIFSEVQGTPFTPVNYSSIAVADVDNDGDQDVLISGYKASNQCVTKLYLNNGNSGFTLSTNSFEGISSGDVAFSDVNNDGFPDIFITGENAGEQLVSKLYINDGTGVYTLSTTSIFEGVYNSAIAFADVDNDGDSDLLIAGQINFSQDISKLYKNDGNGVFTLSASFGGKRYSSVAFTDIDNDSDQDLLITGYNKSTNQTKVELLKNGGNGNFTAVVNSEITALKNGAIIFADFDNDGDQDLLGTGQIEQLGVSSILYSNDGNGNFTNMNSMFLGVKVGKVEFIDIDNDGDQDALIIGGNPAISDQGITALYINDGTGNYIRKTGTGLADIKGISFAISDIDSDGDLDILLNGGSHTDNYQTVTKLYKNDGNEHFTLINGTPFPNANYFNELMFGDVDGDGDQDLFVLGGSSTPITSLYLNDGNGNFSISPQSFTQVFQGMADFADVDSDGDLDLLYAGAQNTGANSSLTKLYINNGAGNFTEATSTPFIGFNTGTLVFADVDGDTDLDVIFSGRNNGSTNTSYSTKLYLNDGTGNYALDVVNSFPNIYFSAIDFADVDKDGDLDMLLNGYGNTITILYLNDGLGEFTQYDDVPFMNVERASFDFADIDDDGDPDVLITGEGKTVLYKNITCFSPVDATTSLSGNTITANIPNTTYNWIDCNHDYQSIGVTTQSFTSIQEGSYAVEITQYGGCTVISNCVEISFLGIQEEDKNNDILLYPNPTYSTLKIKSDVQIDEYSIYNLSGTLMQKGKVLNNLIEIDSLDAGAYIIYLKMEGYLITRKIIKD